MIVNQKKKAPTKKKSSRRTTLYSLLANGSPATSSAACPILEAAVNNKILEGDDDTPDGLSKGEPSLNQQLEDQGIILINGDITTANMGQVIAAVIKKDLDLSFQGELIIFVNSEGGNLPDAWALVDVIEGTSIPITTVGMGVVCSAGTLILAAGDPGHRLLMPRTEVMCHHFSAGLIGSFHNIQETVHGFKIEHNRLVKFWMTHSAYKTQKEVEDIFLRPTDHYMTTKEALRHGIVDKVVPSQRNKKMRLLLRDLAKKKATKKTRERTKKTTKRK